MLYSEICMICSLISVSVNKIVNKSLFSDYTQLDLELNKAQRTSFKTMNIKFNICLAL